MIKYFEDVFEVFKYPAGEPHVRLRKGIESGDSILAQNVRDFNDLSILMIADNILKFNSTLATWIVPYFPFARHDRRIDNWDGEELPLALAIGKELGIVIVDPHSDVSAGLRHYTQADVVELYKNAHLFDNEPIVAIPDAGAIKKVNTWINNVPNSGTIQCLKTRNPKTGNLSGFDVLSDYINHAPVVIVDDICDGGGTFIGLAQELKEIGAGELRLAVTHGLFTKGLDGLTPYFDEIYTLNTCYREKNVRLFTVPVGELLKRNPS